MKFRFTGGPALYLIPALILAWSVYLHFYAGPFYLRSIDPEYIYLVSGLNCATLDFNRIGHVDNPGTFLQLLTGLFFRIIHLFAGNRDLFTDVIANPEVYLAASAMILSVVTSILILWLGRLAYRYTGDFPGALVLQATTFFSVVNLGTYSRYNPERLMMTILVIFFIIYIKYLYDSRFNASKFAAWSGIVMGAGLATKFNFLPVLVLPLFLLPRWRYRGSYVLYLTGSVLFLLLPVSSKFRTLWRTAMEWFLHSGLYGKGSQEILDTSSFVSRIAEIFRSNISFTIIVLLAIAGLLILVTRKDLRRGSKQEFNFLAGALVTILLGVALVAKHYKGYYALPLLTLSSMIFYTVYRLSCKSALKYHLPVSVFLFILLIVIPFARVAPIFTGPNEELQNKRVTESFIREHIQQGERWIVSPIWMTAPIPGNAMALGVSYFHHRHLSYLDFERIYPDILTWEGAGLPLKHMRIREANLAEVLLSGKGIHIYSRPGWNAGEVCGYVEQYAGERGIQVTRDTIYSFSTTGEHIIRIRNSDGWRMTRDLDCGFEKYDNLRFLTDDGLIPLGGKGEIHQRKSANGKYSLRLGSKNTVSPCYLLGGIAAGDVISSSVKSSIPDPSAKEMLRIRVEYTDISGSRVEVTSGPPPGKIDNDWYMSDLYFTVASQPLEGNVTCYAEYTGVDEICLDDLSLRVYSRVNSTPDR